MGPIGLLDAHVYVEDGPLIYTLYTLSVRLAKTRVNIVDINMLITLGVVVFIVIVIASRIGQHAAPWNRRTSLRPPCCITSNTTLRRSGTFSKVNRTVEGRPLPVFLPVLAV